jgi:hypothetical protein
VLFPRVVGGWVGGFMCGAVVIVLHIWRGIWLLHQQRVHLFCGVVGLLC